MKRGFTLIELLAVFVVLAVIIIIAIPKVLSVIDIARKGAFESDAMLVIDAINKEIASNADFDPTTIDENTISSVLGLSNDNYQDVQVTENNGVASIVIVGKNKWNGLTAYGTFHDMKVVKSEDYDITAPTVAFSSNGNSTYAKSRSTTVTVSDSHLDTSSLKYQWTTSTTAPDEESFSTTFNNGNAINTPAGVTGAYYLWILAKDSADPSNTIITRSNVFNLDNTIPVITMSGNSSVTINQGDTYVDAGALANDNIDGNITGNIQTTSTVNPSIVGTYTVTYNVSDTVGNNATSVVRTVNVIAIVLQRSFAFTNDVQTYSVIYTGVYKVEVWGAQGGNAGYGGSVYTYGGTGGYASRIFQLTAGQTINVYVGGQGSGTTDTGTNNQLSGGYNGGGYGYNGSSSGIRGSGGGGATDIRIGGTALSNRVIVAGAGAGGVYYIGNGTNYPGYGGGTNGGNGYTSDYDASQSYHGKRGTQAQGGAGGVLGSTGGAGTLGLGGNAGSAYGHGESGGGAGYYGGGASGSGMAGGGGSSYAGSGGQTIAGNAVMPDPNGGTMTGRTGNGYARITYLENGQYLADKGVNRPRLAPGMTAVKWNGSSWDIITNPDTDTSWYDYPNKIWANAKTTDGSFWVWIPRYSYRISSGWHSATAGTIDVQFSMDIDDTRGGTVSLDSGTGSNASNNKWTNHPAFTFGSTELTGIWVAKFEATAVEGVANGYTSDASCPITGDNVTNKTIKLIPNATSWRCINIGNMFTNTRNMETNAIYGWGTSGSGIDTHLMKNTEWGAVAYLSKSTYGQNTSEIWINPSNNYTTGCAGDSVSSSQTAGCLRSYDTTNGVKASTTGTIYGIYDMNGGAMDNVSAYVSNGSGALGSYGAPITSASAQYKDVYSVGGPDDQPTNYGLTINQKGDSIYETSSGGTGSYVWFSDYSRMPYTFYPWFTRGEYNNSGTNAGIYSFDNTNGSERSYNSFRPVLAVASGL